MGSQRARAACDGGSIYDDRSAFQDVERTARYEGTRLSGKMPSARGLRRKAVRCEYARARAACETGLRVRCGELVPRRPRRPEPDYAGRGTGAPARKRSRIQNDPIEVSLVQHVHTQCPHTPCSSISCTPHAQSGPRARLYWLQRSTSSTVGR